MNKLKAFFLFTSFFICIVCMLTTSYLNNQNIKYVDGIETIIIYNDLKKQDEKANKYIDKSMGLEYVIKNTISMSANQLVTKANSFGSFKKDYKIITEGENKDLKLENENAYVLELEVNNKTAKDISLSYKDIYIKDIYGNEYYPVEIWQETLGKANIYTATDNQKIKPNEPQDLYLIFDNPSKIQYKYIVIGYNGINHWFTDKVIIPINDIVSYVPNSYRETTNYSKYIFFAMCLLLTLNGVLYYKLKERL